MTPEYFISLPDKKREDILTKKGIHLAQLEKGELLFDLYQVDSFYVEFCYFISVNSTVTTKVFTDTENLSPYIDKSKNGKFLNVSLMA
ncbi:MAG: hypothetical protein WKF70_14400 [Chitinophagaceae bacterium]